MELSFQLWFKQLLGLPKVMCVCRQIGIIVCAIFGFASGFSFPRMGDAFKKNYVTFYKNYDAFMKKMALRLHIGEKKLAMRL